MNSKQDDILNIEFRLWNYLDGDYSEVEQQHIKTLLATDEQWQQKYAELQQLHQSLNVTFEVQEPSMRFTQNVMDAVASQKILRPVSSYVNQWVIRGITVFFLAIIGYYFFGILDSINWRSTSTPGSSLAKHFKAVDLSGSTMLSLTFFAMIIAGLMLIDAIIKRRRVHGSV